MPCTIYYGLRWARLQQHKHNMQAGNRWLAGEICINNSINAVSNEKYEIAQIASAHIRPEINQKNYPPTSKMHTEN